MVIVVDVNMAQLYLQEKLMKCCKVLYNDDDELNY